MTMGPGKYDAECTMVRERTKARAAVVLVLGGTHGSGFATQIAASPADAADVARALAMTLRAAAEQLESDARRLGDA
jgi:hypothetical protein